MMGSDSAFNLVIRFPGTYLPAWKLAFEYAAEAFAHIFTHRLKSLTPFELKDCGWMWLKKAKFGDPSLPMWRIQPWDVFDLPNCCSGPYDDMGGSISIIKCTTLVVIRVLLVLFPRSFWDFHWVWNCISSWSLLSLRSSPSLSNDIIRRKVAPRELLGQAFWSIDLHGSQSSSVLTKRFLRWSPR